MVTNFSIRGKISSSWRSFTEFAGLFDEAIKGEFPCIRIYVGDAAVVSDEMQGRRGDGFRGGMLFWGFAVVRKL